MNKSSLLKVQRSPALQGTVSVSGSKNASMVIMLASLLTRGVSRFSNIPAIFDVFQIGQILQTLGATFSFDHIHNVVEIDTTHACENLLSSELMNTTRASVLVLGPLLSRFGSATIGFPGGDYIGLRPIDFHLTNLEKMGATVTIQEGFVRAIAPKLKGARLVLAYPSVGATENILLAAVQAQGRTTIVNAALEPEVLDLIGVLRAMGARIAVEYPAALIIDGVSMLHPVEYTIIPDRLEAGALLVAGAITGGDLYLPNISHTLLEVPLLKLEQMGHHVIYAENAQGVRVIGTAYQRAISFKTGPYPNFPTDLQAPFMSLTACAEGEGIIEETVFESRLAHTHGLTQLGACIEVVHSNKVKVKGVSALQGTSVEAHDIRAVCALVLAGLAAYGSTVVQGVHHWKRGFENLETKLQSVGAAIVIEESS